MRKAEASTTKIVRVSLTKSEWERFRVKAKVHNRTRPLQVRELVLGYINERG